MAPHRHDGGGGSTLMPWSEIFPDLADDPLRGRSYQYLDAATDCRNLKDAMAFCSQEFNRLTGDDGLRELKGAAPAALANVIEQLDGAFHDLPPVFTRLESIFTTHYDGLSALEGEVAAALARANTRWNTLETARTEFDEADAALRAINAQIAELERATDEASIARLDELRLDQPGIASTQRSKSTALGIAEDALAESRTEYLGFDDRELELVRTTRDSLGDVDLNDLKDPGWLADTLGDIGSFFADLGANLFKAFEALISGDFLDALHYLSDALNSILIVIAVVVIAVVIVVATIGTGGAALALLATVATVIGATKLVVDTALAGTGHPHPVTGQPKTWAQVAVDAVLMVLPVPGSRLLGRSIAGRLRSQLPAPGYTSTRAARTYRQNQRVIAAAERGTGMGSRANGNRLTARQVRERAGEARRYNDAYDTAHQTHANNVNRANRDGQRAGEAGPGAVRDLAGEGGKKLAEPVLAGSPDYGDPGPGAFADNPAVREGARHVDRCTRQMRSYGSTGPTSQPGSPYVCLVPAR